MTRTGFDTDRFGTDPGATIRANLAELRHRITAACARAGRDPAEVRLLPITKTVPAEVLRHAAAAGLDMFGENKVQEAMGKAEALADLPVLWSIVGHLQTNKVKHLIRFASEFQALDSLRVAEALDARLRAEGRTLDVFVQVNTSGEPSKYGVAPEEAAGLVARLPDFPSLRPVGLMTLAIFSAETERVRACFRLLRDLRETLRATPAGAGLAHLSMGMSGDFEAAIEEGATVVRIGTAIFGTRPTKDGIYWPGLFPEVASA
jgi:pyridoxal phosphate enzyme (YggS family)